MSPRALGFACTAALLHLCASPSLAADPRAGADGTVEETFDRGVVGCAGAVTFAKRATLCGPGYRPIAAPEWVLARHHQVPAHHYWTDDTLAYLGSSPHHCAASRSRGSECPAGQPMRVCADTGNDPEGNLCNWVHCGLDQPDADDYFGGCASNPTAGTLCAPAGCATGSVQQVFSAGMVGCAGQVTWDARASLCAPGFRPASAAEWVALRGNQDPTANYWTHDTLRGSGRGTGACRASLTTGNACPPNQPMHVCTRSGADAQGNTCNWTGCGLDVEAPHDFFGGCTGDATAGVLCLPSGCAGGTVEHVLADGMVACSARSTCAVGFRLASPAERASVAGDLTVCLPSGCADGTVEQVLPNGMVGCAGAVLWQERHTLCASGWRPVSAQEWVALRERAVPAYNYWTNDALRYVGDSHSCAASRADGRACAHNAPMRVCSPAQKDPMGNLCNWTHCGLESVESDDFFGGCTANLTASTLCIRAACADAATAQIFANGMMGCAGAVPWSERQSLCASGAQAATASQWLHNRLAAAPTSNYWTDETLYSKGGGSGACSVSSATGRPCPLGMPMRVCTDTGVDAQGNRCNWTHCGYATTLPDAFFGGCTDNPSAGALCIAP